MFFASWVEEGRGVRLMMQKKKTAREYVVAVKIIMELVNGIKERDNSIHPQ